MLYQLAGRPQEVCDHLYEAYILDPESCDPQLLFHLANNLKAIGENDAAVDFYAQAIGGRENAGYRPAGGLGCLLH